MVVMPAGREPVLNVCSGRQLASIVLAPEVSRLLTGVGIRVVEDIERALLGADWDFECFTGFGVLNEDCDAVVLGVPEQLDVDTVADAAVKFASDRFDRGVGGFWCAHRGSLREFLR